MINITNGTLASDYDWQREAPKVWKQIYYTTTKIKRCNVTNDTLACDDD